jgi:hypothetical protein
MNRLGFIGGSDLGDVLAIEPYGCPLRAWLRKRGEGGGAEATPAMRRGSRLEAIIAEEYSAATGRKLRRAAEVKDSHFPWRRAHPDYHIVAFDGRGPGLLSIKCLGLFPYKSVKREGLPQAYAAQLNYELGLAGWEWGAFAVFNAELWEMIHWDANFDAELYGLTLRAVDDFWRRAEHGPAPEPLDAKARPCRRCEFRGRCHPFDPPPFDGETVTDESLAPLVCRYAEAAAVRSDAEELLDAVKAEIKAALGDRQCVATSAGRIDFYTQDVKGYTVAPRKQRTLRVYPSVTG